jgi:hypothetical protein
MLPKMSDKERETYILSDGGLRWWYESSKLPMKEFIEKNRQEIDEVIWAKVGDA